MVKHKHILAIICAVLCLSPIGTLHSWADSVMLCRVGKTVFSFKHGEKEIHITLYTQGKDPMYRGLNTDFCDYERTKIKSKKGELMIISSGSNEIIIPSTCYGGGDIITQSMRVSWDHRDLMLTFDEYHYKNGVIKERSIYRIGDEFVC